MVGGDRARPDSTSAQDVTGTTRKAAAGRYDVATATGRGAGPRLAFGVAKACSSTYRTRLRNTASASPTPRYLSLARCSCRRRRPRRCRLVQSVNSPLVRSISYDSGQLARTYGVRLRRYVGVRQGVDQVDAVAPQPVFSSAGEMPPSIGRPSCGVARVGPRRRSFPAAWTTALGDHLVAALRSQPVR